MAKRLKTRQDNFCRHYIRCYDPAAAAARAGYSPRSAASQASRLLRDPIIQARIAILQAEMSQGGCRDLEALIAKLENIYSRAINLGNYSAATAIVTAQARLLGLGPPRPKPAKEAKAPTPEAPDSPLTVRPEAA
ncbi:MAG: terminase small subunit [Rhodospirillales bacterium]|nr:terminase small subunit [Rhodospirillales bacterium]